MINQRIINSAKRKYNFIVLLLYSSISILLNINPLTVLISGDSLILLRLVDSMPLYIMNYANVFAPQFSWNYFLSVSSFGFDYLSARYLFCIIGKIFNLTAPSLAIIERIFVQLIGFLGAYILCKYFLLKSFHFSRATVLVSFIAGLFYGVSPSFMIGDLPRPFIELAYAMLPWILWSFNKVVLDRKQKHIVICAVLIALNVDEHFLWVGFPLILALYSVFILIMRSVKERRLHFHSILSFFGVMILFILLIFYRVSIRLISFSSYSYALTKAGLDICWKHATMLNMLRAMSHMSLPNIYVPPENLIFQFLNSLMPLTLIIPAIAFLALLFYRKNWVVLFYSILLLISILPFYVGSPFKRVHYWIFFNTPIGPAFRTWRIPDAYIALSLSVLMAFSLRYIFEKLYKRRKQVLIGCITAGILFLFCVYSWPLLTGDVNGYLSPVKVPEEYSDVYNYFMNIPGSYRIVYVPDFSHSYGPNTNLKPFWSPRWGMIPEFLFFSSPKPTIPAGWSGTLWNPYYKFTLSYYYYWSLLREGDTGTLSHFLGWTNLKYVVIHNDIPAIAKRVKKSIQFLNVSDDFKLVFHDGFIYVFENKLAKGEIYVPAQLILVDGGYRVIRKFYNSINDSNTYGFIFIDQGVSSSLLKNIRIVLTDKPQSQLIEDLAFNVIFEQHPEFVIYPYKYVVSFDPKNKWSRASLLDAENQVWHPFVDWKNYAWDFDYMKGVVFTINSEDKFTVPLKIEERNSYVLLVRCLVSEEGGSFKIYINGQQFKISTFGNYNGFLWKVIKLGTLHRGKYRLIVQNINGFNAINLFVLIPEEMYHKVQGEVEKFLQNKTIIYVFKAESDLYRSNTKIIRNSEASYCELVLLGKNSKVWQYVDIIKNGTYRIALKGSGEFEVEIGNKSFVLRSSGLNFAYSPAFHLTKGEYKLEVIPLNIENLVKNPSFEIGTKFWNWKTKEFLIRLDNTTSYDGKYSLRVSTSINRKGTWSWIRSEPISVEPGKEYLIITHMKIRNTNASHIVIEGWRGNKVVRQLIQCPCGVTGTGTYGWKEFVCKIKIPKDVDNIRVVLNAGWVLNKSKGEAITWFDDIQVIPLKEVPKLDVIWLYSVGANQTIGQLLKVRGESAKIVSYEEINPTLWRIEVNTTKPFMLSFAESYNPLWEARVYKNGKLAEKVRSIPLYSVINGFWINETGELEIVVRYVPQEWFELGLRISMLTFIGCVSYVIYDWRRERGDGWAKEVERKIKEVWQKLRYAWKGEKKQSSDTF